MHLIWMGIILLAISFVLLSGGLYWKYKENQKKQNKHVEDEETELLDNQRDCEQTELLDVSIKK